jgi:NPCBM/NEW2 domain
MSRRWKVILSVLAIGLLVVVGWGIGAAFHRPGLQAVDPGSPDLVYLSTLEVIEPINWPFRGPLPGPDRPPEPADRPPLPGGQRVSVQGKGSPHGIWMHLPPEAPQKTSVSYRLGKNFSTFNASVSLNDGPRDCTPMTFTVYGDGHPLWQSKPVAQQMDTQECKGLSVKDVEKLTLEVSGKGDARGTHAVWIEPSVSERP